MKQMCPYSQQVELPFYCYSIVNMRAAVVFTALLAVAAAVDM